MKRPRILLADDHALVLFGSRTLLDERCEVVGTASDGRALIQAVTQLKPDLVVLDISMPGLTGIEAARQIKAELPDVKILFFTMHSERAYVQSAFEAGASGYVLKTAATGELLDAVGKVLNGQLYTSQDLAANFEHVRDSGQVARSLRLSGREREVLQLISEGKSAKEIAHLLNIAVKTTSFHRENIKRKLGVKTTAELTRNAIAMGFVSVGSDPILNSN